MIERLNEFGKFLGTEFSPEQLALINILIFNNQDHKAYADAFERGDFEACKEYLLTRKDMLVVENVPAEKLEYFKSLVERGKRLFGQNNLSDRKLAGMSNDEINSYMDTVIDFIGDTRPSDLSGAIVIVISEVGMAHYNSNIGDEEALVILRGVIETISEAIEAKSE